MMDEAEIKRMFRDFSPYGLKPISLEGRYHISTGEIIFEYDGNPKTVKDVSLLAFNDGKVWFDDESFEMDRISVAPFMMSTNPSRKMHPLVLAYYRTKPIIDKFG